MAVLRCAYPCPEDAPGRCRFQMGSAAATCEKPAHCLLRRESKTVEATAAARWRDIQTTGGWNCPPVLWPTPIWRPSFAPQRALSKLFEVSLMLATLVFANGAYG